MVRHFPNDRSFGWKDLVSAAHRYDRSRNFKTVFMRQVLLQRTLSPGAQVLLGRHRWSPRCGHDSGNPGAGYVGVAANSPLAAAYVGGGLEELDNICQKGPGAGSALPPGPSTMSLRNEAPASRSAGDFGLDVFDDEVNTVPAAGPRLRRRPAWASCGAGRSAQQQPTLCASDVGEGGIARNPRSQEASYRRRPTPPRRQPCIERSTMSLGSIISLSSIASCHIPHVGWPSYS